MDLGGSLFGVIMAGGRGERFWPLSRLERPKQFLVLKGEKSLLELTYERVLPLFDEERILIITRKEYSHSIKEILPQVCILEEPIGRNTGPACFYSTWWVKKRYGDALLALLPSDHWVKGWEGFRETLKVAFRLASEGYLVTLGIKPKRPETGYGYIEKGKLIWKEPLSSYLVKSFKEKPKRETAIRYFDSGNFFWNSGIFIWRSDVILDAFKKHAPLFIELSEKIDLERELEEFYREVPDISIDYLIMEKAEKRAVVEANFDWEDLGSFASLSFLLKKEEGNFSKGDVISVESKGNILWSEKGLLAVLGIKDLVVIHTEDVTLVAPISEVQRIKEIFKSLEKNEDLKKYLHR